MITGDYHHTAVAVAKSVGMVKPDSQVVVINTLQKEMAHAWSPDHLRGAPSQLASQIATNDGMSPPTSPQPSIEAKRGAVSGRRVSFKAPWVLQMSSSLGSTSNKVAFASPGAAASISNGPSEAAPLTRQPCEAALPTRQPTEAAWLNTLSSDSIMSPRYRLPTASSTSLQMPPERSQSGQMTMRRSVSLSRLPSQVFSPMASLPPDSANDDSAIRSKQQPRSPSMHPVIHFPIPEERTRHSCHRVTQDTDPLLLPSASGNPLRGLTFTPARGRYHMDPHEAFTAMSEGSMQCAVTGHALEYLLQLADV